LSVCCHIQRRTRDNGVAAGPGVPLSAGGPFSGSGLKVPPGKLKGLCFLAVFLSALLLAPVLLPAADDNEFEDAEIRYQQVQSELEQERERIRVLRLEETSLLSELDRMDRLLSEHRQELRRLREESRKLSLQIQETTERIAITSANLEQQRERLRARLQALYRQHRAGDIAALVSADDYQSLIQEARLLGYLTHADTLLINRYRHLVQEMESLNASLGKARLDVEQNSLRLRLKKQEVEKEKENRQFLLSRVRKNRSYAERLVGELEQAARDLKVLIEQAAEAARIPPGTPFADLRGELPWPVTGRVSSYFGSQNDPLFDTPVFRNGIEIMAEEEAAVTPVHSGVVAYADWFKGFGQLIIINHGSGYHTLYANLAQMFVKPGDVVEHGQMVARVAESDTYRGSSMYFELRHKGKPMDPLKWLIPLRR